MDLCPFCGKQYHALKNHVRLTSGGGHGPSGQYPDEFDSGLSGYDKDTGERSISIGLTSERSGADTNKVAPPDNLSEEPEALLGGDEAPTRVEQGTDSWGRNRIRDEPEKFGIESPARVVKSTATQFPSLTCPECGDRLETDVGGIGYLRKDGALLELEDTDGLCNSCDLVVPNRGDVIYGSDYGSRKDPQSSWDTITLVIFSGLAAFLVGFWSRVRENDDDTRLL